MLYKFSCSDILNSALLDTHTGAVKYNIITRPHFIHAPIPGSGGRTELVPSRRSYLLDASGKKLASWGWTLAGQPTDICIGREKLDGPKGLFGSMGPPPSDTGETKGQLHHSSVIVKNRLVRSPLHSGNHYLELESHPMVTDVELITTFVLMEIMRRSRFANQKSSAAPASCAPPRSWLSRTSGKISQGLTRAMV
ncbi:hypothetical protein HWV62_35035 [Athelia sp. TMB]|nr:hypothetical protein HWV62_35035 [Athelia sp. TMB]